MLTFLESVELYLHAPYTPPLKWILRMRLHTCGAVYIGNCRSHWAANDTLILSLFGNALS